MDHPHHILPKIFALANAFKDEEFKDEVDAENSRRLPISSSPRTDASQNLLRQLKNNKKLRHIIEQWEKMSNGRRFYFQNHKIKIKN